MTRNSTHSKFETFEQAFKNSEPLEPVTVSANRVEPGDGQHDTVTDRQKRVDGFSQETFAESSVLVVGAGGLGCQICRGLVRKGIGELVVCDEDYVEVSNLSRQTVFYEEDIGKNKAIALAENLEREGTCGTEITGIPLHFQDAVARGHDFSGVDIVVVAPDSDEARLAVADHFLDRAPVVVVGLGMDASNGYVFVQQPDRPCFKCWRGENAGGGQPCGPTPAALDPAMAVSGIVLYAVDSVLMDRYAEWNLQEVFLSGLPGPTARMIEQDERCPLCGDSEAATEGEIA